MTEIKLVVPLTSIEIDGDRRAGIITLSDGNAAILSIMAAMAEPGRLAVVKNEPEEPAEEGPKTDEGPAMVWRPAQGRCLICNHVMDARNKGWGPDDVLCDGNCDGLTDGEGEQ